MPTLRTDRLVAGFIYYDARTDDARLTLAIARTAVLDHGAVAANYAPVTGLLKDDGRIRGACLDVDGAGPLEVRASVVVNATGVWADRVSRVFGMLGNRANAAATAEFLEANKFAHVVLDPIMKSSGGTELLDSPGVKFVATEMLKRASVITPNVPEAEVLTGLTIKDVAGMEAAARKLVEMGARAVIVKGGHMEKAVDVLFDGSEMMPLVGDKGKEETLHGTGCTFASAITAHLAVGRGLLEAATLSKAYVMKAIEKAYPIGKGRTPLDHFYRQRIEPPARGIHEVPQHGLHPAAEPATH